MVRICFFICLLSCVVCSYAAPVADMWQKANNAYTQKQYDTSAFYYEQVAAANPQEAAVFYNLGNTYFRLNKIGAAVLNYQKALYIDPGYKDAADNLYLTESRISNRIPDAGDIFFVKWWHLLTAAKNTTSWSVTALLVFLVIIALGIYKQFNNAATFIRPQLIGILLCIVLVCLTLAIIAARNQQNSNMGVVMQNDAPLMADQHAAKTLLLVPEGTTVSIMDNRSGWIMVRLPDGRTGWLQETLVNKI